MNNIFYIPDTVLNAMGEQKCNTKTFVIHTLKFSFIKIIFHS